MNRKIVIAMMAACAASAGSAAEALTAAEQDALWASYCSADGKVERRSAQMPKPNYSNPVVKAAAEKLNYIRQANDAVDGAMNTFYFYGDIMGVYGVKGVKPAYTPEWVSADANAYLTIACGEFRDNVRMMERKIKWARDIVVVPAGEQTYDPSKGVWEQLTGEGYGKLVEISENIYEWRSKDLKTNASLTLEQKAVDGMTVCEYRYILKNYLAGDRKLEHAPWWGEEGAAAFRSWEEYKLGLAEMMASDECSEDEKNHYNEFRGDGNFKAQSLESNAFIWNSRVYAKGCRNLTTARKQKGNILTDADCENYFKAPWAGREELTRQGALRLFFYPETLDRLMRDYGGSLVLVTEDLNGDQVADMVIFEDGAGSRAVERLREEAQYAQQSGDYAKVTLLRDMIYKYVLKAATEQVALGSAYDAAKAALEDAGDLDTSGIRVITDLHGSWNASMLSRPDRGFAEVFPEPAKAWDRLATVLDRHTDWYQIDMVNLQTGVYQPTFSPWVASSYYIHESDAFTSPGYAMGMAGDGRKHWMYVQRVAKDKWFTTDSMRAEWPKNIDLLNTWFDETTFSRSVLGAREKAWDRFGSAAPEEIEVALWLFESGGNDDFSDWDEEWDEEVLGE